MRKIAVALAILVFVLALAVVLVPRLVSIESLKPRIVAALEEKTGHTIGLDRISLSLFPGIGVRIAGLSVSGDDRHPEERLLVVPEGEVRLAIAPLFSGKAEFTTFILRRPKILFHKYADGTHSATQIAARLAREEKAGAAKPPSASDEKISIALRSVSIEAADLSLRMEEQEGGETRWDISPFTFRLGGIGGTEHEFEIGSRIEGAVRGEISFSGTASHEKGAISDPSMFDLRGAGTLFGQKVEVHGKMSAPSGLAEVDLTVALPRIEMDRLASLWKDPPQALRDARLEGVGGLVLKIAGNLQSMGFEADADLTRAGWTLSREPEVRKYIDIACKGVLQGHWFPDLLVISNAELSTPPLLLIGNGSLVPSTGRREWSVSSRVASLAEFGKIRGGGLDAFSPTGRLTASGMGKRAQREAEDRYRLGVDLGEVGFRVPGRRMEFRSLDGHVELTHRKIEFAPLAGLFNGQRFSLRGTASLGPAPEGQVDLRMALLDVDTLFPPGERDAGAVKSGEAGGKGKRPESGAARPLSVRVNLGIDAGKARGLEFRDLRGLAIYERQTLFLDSVQARMYGGEVSVTGHIGLAGPSPDFRAKASLKNVEAGEILSRKTSLGGLLSGPVTLAAELGGKAGDFSEFARTAEGSGSFRVPGGTIRGVDLLGTAIGLAGLSNLLPPSVAGKGDEKTKETPFGELAADFRVRGGRIETDALRIVSSKMGFTGNAALRFDRTIEVRGMLRLSDDLSGRARKGVGKFLTGKSGEVEIPLVLSGPVTGPEVAIDAGTLAKGVSGELLRGAAEKLRGPAEPIPKDNAATRIPGDAKEKPGPKEELEGLFRKLLPGR